VAVREADRIAAVTAPGHARRAAASQGLAALAVQLLLKPPAAVGPAAFPPRFSPVVVVSTAAAGASRCLESCAGIAAGLAAWCGIWDGPALGREISAAAAADQGARLLRRMTEHRLVVVDDVDQLGSAERERSFAQLFDAATGCGTAFCLSLTSHPARAAIDPGLATRLAAGLVVSLPAPVPATPAPVRQAPAVRRVFRIVARHYGLPLEDLLGPSRRRVLAEARGVGMYLARSLTAESFGSIGADCGGRDHTTVMHAARLVAARLASEPGFAADLEVLTAAITGDTPAPRAGRRRRRVGSPSGRRVPPSRHR
jgi:hypothetical protein